MAITAARCELREETLGNWLRIFIHCFFGVSYFLVAEIISLKTNTPL
jgi:hypothetical protein